MSHGNDLFVIEKNSIGATLVDTVSARALHDFLDIGKRFATWINDRIEQYGFVENEDYIVLPNFGKAQPCGLAANRKEYFITIDMAKELSMVERNDKGKQARQYFIRCEKELMSRPSPAIPQDYASALRLAADTHEQLLLAQQREAEKQAMIEDQRPDIEFVQQITHDPSSMSVAQAAKSIGTGEKRLYEFMRQNGWVDRKNVPYQSRVSAGMMDFSRSRYDSGNGEMKDKYTARITEKGKRLLLKNIKEKAPEILDIYKAKAKSYREATGK